jgi:putative hydrolase of HD superfamily
VGYVLASLENEDKKNSIDVGKVMAMCLFHDMAETRVSDLNWTHQKYVTRDEKKAVHDIVEPLPFGKDMLKTIHEYEKRASREAVIAKDADSLELLLSLKEEIDIGNSRAKTLLPSLIKRLKTDTAKKLAKTISKTSSDHWWFANQGDPYWVNRGEKS